MAARVIEGDYETYQRIAQQEAETLQAKAAATASVSQATESRGSEKSKSEKRKRKFPYRKAADLEREIGEHEAKVAELEDLLGQPATWRDPIKARATQQQHEDLKSALARLYEHWEEALELNS